MKIDATAYHLHGTPKSLVGSVLLALCFIASQSVLSQNAVEKELTLTVLDKNGQAVTGLGPSDFNVRDGNQEVAVTSVRPSGTMTIGLVVDVSGSSDKKSLPFVADALTKFVKNEPVGTQYFIETFQATGLVTDFATDASRVVDGLRQVGTLEVHGNTAVYDALALALEKVQTGKYPNQALVVVTDGEDNTSRLNFRKLGDMLSLSNVPVYVICPRVSDGPLGLQGEAFIDEITAKSGGWPIYPKSYSALDEVLTRLSDVLQHQYLVKVELMPSAKVKDHTVWHRLNVKAASLGPSSRDDLQVKGRLRYNLP